MSLINYNSTMYNTTKKRILKKNTRVLDPIYNQEISLLTAVFRINQVDKFPYQLPI